MRISGSGEPSTDPPLDPGTGEPTLRTGGPGDTCHLDVADRFGNMVSATPSGGWLQSSPVIPGLGFCLGTRAQMFTLTPGLPATLAPGKRPRTTLTPSLALRDGEPYLAFGTPGGDQQDQWSLLFFLNHALAGMNLQQAIDFPAFHSAHMPSSFYPRQAQPRVVDIESRADPAVIEELRRRGHLVTVRPALVARPGQRGGPPRRNAVRGGQRARHAGLRRRPLSAPGPPRAGPSRLARPDHNRTDDDRCHGRPLRDGTTGRRPLRDGMALPADRRGPVMRNRKTGARNEPARDRLQRCPE